MGEGGGALRDIGCSTDSGEPLKHREAGAGGISELVFGAALHCTANVIANQQSCTALLFYSGCLV